MTKRKLTKDAEARLRLSAEHKRLFEKAAAVMGCDLSTFIRQACLERVGRLRAAGEKL